MLDCVTFFVANKKFLKLFSKTWQIIKPFHILHVAEYKGLSDFQKKFKKFLKFFEKVVDKQNLLCYYSRVVDEITLLNNENWIR